MLDLALAQLPQAWRPTPGKPGGPRVLARCEIHAFRYRVLHVAARITHSARRTHLRLDQRWRWATQIAAGFHRIRAAQAWCGPREESQRE